MATGTCTPRARDLSQMTFSAIFRDARGQSLQCQQRDEYLQAIRTIAVRGGVGCGKDNAALSGSKPTRLAVRDHHKRSLGGKSPRKLSNSIAGLAAAGSSRYRQNIAAIPASASILPPNAAA